LNEGKTWTQLENIRKLFEVTMAILASDFGLVFVVFAGIFALIWNGAVVGILFLD
jgi:hypothetical protein